MVEKVLRQVQSFRQYRLRQRASHPSTSPQHHQHLPRYLFIYYENRTQSTDNEHGPEFWQILRVAQIKTATLHYVYMRQNADIIPVSDFNVITVVVFHLRIKNTYTTDAFMYNTNVAVFYYCLLYEQHNNIINLIFVSCCHLANRSKNECNHRYLYPLGGRQLCQNFEPIGLVTLIFDLLSLEVVFGSYVTWALCQFQSSWASLFSSQVRCTRHTDIRQKHRLMPPPIRGGGIIIHYYRQTIGHLVG